MPHLQQSTDSNRSEFLKHISIVSVAGLGFNLIRDNRPGDLGWDYELLFWGASTLCFLLTVLGVIVMFYLISMRSESLEYAEEEDIEPLAREDYLAKAERLQKNILRLTGAISLLFTAAIISAIINIIRLIAMNGG